MKRITIFLLFVLFAPAMLFAQLNVTVIDGESTDLKVTIPGYNDRIPAAVMNMKFEFDQETETLLVRLGSSNESPKYDKIWLPQHDIQYEELGSYMHGYVVYWRVRLEVNQESQETTGSPDGSLGW